MKEEKIQAECFKWFHNTYCLKNNKPRYCMFSVPNEAIQKMGWKQISKFKATGLKAGVSDTIVLMNGKILFIEFKTFTGNQSKPQKEFQTTVEKLGFEYHICRSLEEFKIIIKNKT